MDSNWFKDLFINEAKNALAGRGSGSNLSPGPSVEVTPHPTHLSQFTNDLFGSMREPVLTLTVADFTIDGETAIYEGPNVFKWLTQANQLGFELVTSDGNTYTEKNMPVMRVDIDGVVVYVLANALYVVPSHNSTEPDPETVMVTGNVSDMASASSITFYRTGDAKIPGKYVDVKTPTCLSDLVNDLFGNVRKPVLTFTKDDFAFIEPVGYIASKPMDWESTYLNGNEIDTSKIAYDYSFTTGENSGTGTEADVPFYCGGSTIEIMGLNMRIMPADIFTGNMDLHACSIACGFKDFALLGDFKFTLCTKYTAKIPAEFIDGDVGGISEVDATEIINELSDLESEVNQA